MDIWKRFGSLGTSGIKEKDEIIRIKTVNITSLFVTISVLTLGPIICFCTDHPAWIKYAFVIEFLINGSVLYFNYRGEYRLATRIVYYLQCLVLPIYASALPWLIRLEFIAILQMVMVYELFVHSTEKKFAVGITAAELIALEIIYFFHFRPLTPAGVPFFPRGYIVLTAIEVVLVGVIIAITYLYVMKPFGASREENPRLEKEKATIKLFVAELTHELRTSLDNIHQVTQLLKKEAANQDDLKRIQPLHDIIHSAGCDARNIVNNVLDMAEIEAGKDPLTRNEAIEVEPFFEKMLEVYKVVAHEERMSLQLYTHMPPIILGDPLILTQIVGNLVTNAIKFGFKDHSVIVELSRRDPYWELKVSNFGPGIPEEKRNEIFDPFYTGKTARIQGTGLGLYIVKKKVEAMNGTIMVDSKRGGYTIFRISLPLIEVDPDDLTKHDRSLLPRSGMHDLRNVHVLMAEDSKLTSFLMFRFLQEQGCKVTMVSNGMELLEKAQAGYPGYRPDIIILDCHMPVLNGEQTIRQLKKMPGLSQIPIIVTTGDIYSDNMERMLEAGADTFLKKPIDHAALQKTIGSYLKRRV